MKDNRESKWPAIIFFMTTGFFFFGCVWYLYAGTMNPEYYWRSSPRSSQDRLDPGVAKNERILLEKNQSVRVGDTCIVYRGTQGGTLVLDLFVLALDPHYGYLHRVDEKKARHGFSMGEHRFRLLAASGDRISLQFQ